MYRKVLPEMRNNTKKTVKTHINCSRGQGVPLRLHKPLNTTHLIYTMYTDV